MAKSANRNVERAPVSERARNDIRAPINERARNDVRARIAHLAARIMAEDGVEDHGLAKRKAAKQAGIVDSRQLPGNDEIDAALREYREIYQADHHREQLIELREIAVRAMTEFEKFNPHLVGNVLSGIAGKYAGIQIQLFTDDIKAVELYLIDLGAEYEVSQTHLYSGDARITVPLFMLDDDGIEIELAVLSPREARVPLKTSPSGKAIERAKLAAVEELLAQT